MKKGFTLIELLAVIVILAIIALIATPLIMNTIEQSKRGAFKSTAYGIVEAGELGYADDVLDGTVGEVTFTYNNGEETSEPSGKSLKYKGNKPQNGQIKVNSEGKVALAIHDGTNCAQKGYAESEVYISDKTVDKCIITGDGNVIGGEIQQPSDTTPPELTIPSDITIYDFEVASFNVMDGVSATDDSGGSVDITISGNISSIAGVYTITYTATDLSNNETVLERTITVDGTTYYAGNKGVNAPVLATGMTPIKWNGTSWVNTTEDDVEWYDYSNKQWANAQTQDGSFWVWIPRYAYQIASGYHTSTAGTINVKFLIDNTDTTYDSTTIEETPTYSGDSQTNYVTHPAFTFGTDEVPGIWVAKFEPSVANQSDACYTNSTEINCDKTTLTPKIIPNANSWRNIKVGNAFEVALAMKDKTSTYGWNNTEVDTHMMKNIEWGAVTYLSNSTYGKETEVWINPNSNFITGCAGTSVDNSSTTVCNTYDTTIGQEASTTGNIYGIYDMNGGAWEQTVAYVNNGNSYLTTYGSNILSADNKYKDVYVMGITDSRDNNYESNATIFGDAVYETSNPSFGSWYNDGLYMPALSLPWFHRGGGYYNADGAGLFNFLSRGGNLTGHYSFRPVLVQYNSPVVTFSPYDNFSSTTVTVTGENGIDNSSLKYYWQPSTEPYIEPSTKDDFTQTFTNGETLTKPSTIMHVLWIYAEDNKGHATITSSGYSSGMWVTP